MAYKLREYQSSAVAATFAALDDHDSVVTVMPTGSGKTPVLAHIASQIAGFGGSVLILAHRKELVEQSVEKLTALGLTPSVYAASLSRKEIGVVTVAQIQSACRQPDLFPSPTLCIIDEAHTTGDDEDCTYREFLSTIKPRKILGLTATPFRMKGGLIYGEGKFFERVAHEVPIKPLIEQGYLSKLRSNQPYEQMILVGMRTVAGEYVMSEVAPEATRVIDRNLADILTKCQDRSSWLMFTPTVNICQQVTCTLREKGIEAACILGDTPQAAREELIRRFRARELRCLVNVDVLTTGFDAPNVDAVILLRPTQSLGLYHQMVGRGLRIAEGKADCLVLDYAGNISRHGPIDLTTVGTDRHGKLAPVYPMTWTCPKCEDVNPGMSGTCQCGHIKVGRTIERQEPEYSAEAEYEPVVGDEPFWLPVTWTHYAAWEKPGKPLMIRIDYTTPKRVVSRWICPEHTGFAQTIAQKWCQSRGIKFGKVNDILWQLSDAKHPKRIFVKRRDKFFDVIREEL